MPTISGFFTVVDEWTNVVLTRVARAPKPQACRGGGVGVAELEWEWERGKDEDEG
jgi:hypothetical protein